MITVFLVLLAVSGLIDVALGLWAVLGWESFANVFNLNLASGVDIRMMGFLLGLVLLFFAYVQVQAILWIRKEKEDGYPIAFAFAGWLVVSSVLMTLFFHRLEFLVIDGARGVLLGVFATLAIRSPLTVKELRLPHKARRSSSRRSSEGPRSRRRPARGSSTRRPRRSPGGRREAPARASSRRSDSRSGSERGSRGGARRRGGSRGDSDRRSSRSGDSDSMRRPPRDSSYRDRRPRERQYNDRRPSRRRSDDNGGFESDRAYGADQGGYHPEREREAYRPSDESTAPSRSTRDPIAGPALDAREDTAPREPRDRFANRRPVREEQSEEVRNEVRDEPAAPVVDEVVERTGPPEPMAQRGPQDVVSALDWFESPKAEKSGQDSSENGRLHRRKKGRGPGAHFRPKEKRSRRPLGGDANGSQSGNGEPVVDDLPDGTQSS